MQTCEIIIGEDGYGANKYCGEIAEYSGWASCPIKGRFTEKKGMIYKTAVCEKHKMALIGFQEQAQIDKEVSTLPKNKTRGDCHRVAIEIKSVAKVKVIKKRGDK